MGTSYNPAKCDLCGSTAHETVASVDAPRGMTSDSRILRRYLKKIICLNCGLVRDGLGFKDHVLYEHYEKDYQLNTNDSGEEHVFYTRSGPVPRSQMIHDWIVQIKPTFAGKLLEVGCGQGSVLERLAESFPQARFAGIDLNDNAVARARRKGLEVHRASSSEIDGEYDTIIAFGVLEHVPSPTCFLQDLQEHLSNSGEVIIGQPMQDVPSYDLFFVDHLHHFTTEHVRLLGQRAGFEQISVLKGSSLVSNFSLHRFRKAAESAPVFRFEYPASTQSVREYLGAFSKVNDFLIRKEKVAVFGTGEVFTLLYAYSQLANAHITCGLDDNKDRQQKHSWPFPVIAPEEARKQGVSDVLLAVNPRYNEMVSTRLTDLGLRPIAVL